MQLHGYVSKVDPSLLIDFFAPFACLCPLHLQCYKVYRGRFRARHIVLWCGLFSQVGASHRVNLIGPFVVLLYT